MNHVYYRYPIRLNKLMKGDEMPTCDVGASISQLLDMLLHSRFNELRSDPRFGCAIWEREFDNTMNQYIWEVQLMESLTAAVRQYEPRLHEVSVRVELKAPTDRQVTVTRRVAHVSVKARIQMTGEAFSFSTQLLLGTLSGR